MFGRRQRAAPDTFSNEVLGYLEPLYATAMRLTRNRADAEDLVQDTMVRALRFRDRFEPGTNLRAWLYTILHNTWRNRIRDTAREATDVDSERIVELASGAGGPSVVDTREGVLLRSAMEGDWSVAVDGVPDSVRQAVGVRVVVDVA
jgi:RNA polymerase sigma-70 factor (ECF subfamily)